MAGKATAVSDIERAEHLNYADSKGVKRVSVFNDGVQVNIATAENQDDILTEVGPLSVPKTSTVTLTNADTAYKLPDTEQVDRRSIIIYNVSDTDIYYGDSLVTTANGILLASGAEVSLDVSQDLYAVCGTAGKQLIF